MERQTGQQVCATQPSETHAHKGRGGLEELTEGVVGAVGLGSVP